MPRRSRESTSLLARPDVDAVYIATPTVAKEEIALAAIAAGKHVLVDKPFVNHASVLRMTQAAAAKGVVFMDATHFVHHPRTAAIRAAMRGEDRLATFPPHDLLLPVRGPRQHPLRPEAGADDRAW